MSEFLCPQTGEPCPARAVCEEYTDEVAESIKEERAKAVVRHRALVRNEMIDIDGVGFRIRRATPLAGPDGQTSLEIGDFTDQEIREQMPSVEHYMDLAEMAVHDTARKSLPVPYNPERVEDRHFDEYFQAEGIVCLRGLVATVNDIMRLPADQREKLLSEILMFNLQSGMQIDPGAL